MWQACDASTTVRWKAAKFFRYALAMNVARSLLSPSCDRSASMCSGDSCSFCAALNTVSHDCAKLRAAAAATATLFANSSSSSASRFVWKMI